MLFVSAFILMITPSFAQGGMKKAHDKERGKAKMEEMFNQLELSADQIEVVKKILKEERISLKETRIPKEEMEAMNPQEKKVARAKMVLKRDEVKQRTKGRLAEVLSPSQMDKFLLMKEEKREMIEDRRNENKD